MYQQLPSPDLQDDQISCFDQLTKSFPFNYIDPQPSVSDLLFSTSIINADSINNYLTNSFFTDHCTLATWILRVISIDIHLNSLCQFMPMH